jgi:hypothetical protein
MQKEERRRRKRRKKDQLACGFRHCRQRPVGG